jgi:flagellar basal body-associated protein FliL
MDPGENAEVQRTRNARRIALISLITLVVLVVIAVGIYVVAFVILSPMI